MRVLFSSLPAHGHFNSLMPLAQATAAAGHEVGVCCAPSFAETVAGFGFQHLAGGASTFKELFVGAPPPSDRDRRAWAQRVAFATNGAGRMLPDLTAHVEAWQPDLLVRESAEYAACLVAEQAGLPHASLGTGSMSSWGDQRALLAEPLTAWRQRLGLPDDPDAEMIFRYLQIALQPSRWDPPETVHPATVHFTRYENPQRPGELRPAWLDGPRSNPLVLASLGTVMHDQPGLFEAIIEAVGGEPIDVVAAVGIGQDPGRFGTPPANVRIEPFVPQLTVLGECAMFVTHGGFNSAKEAMSLGIPMVVIPIGADQHNTADRVEALGLGKAVRPEERDPAIIRDRVREVLRDQGYRERAEAFATEIRALPPIGHAVELMEQLVRDRLPILREQAAPSD